jgi:transcriptional regulator of acetoin/glycerol metabolism
VATISYDRPVASRTQAVPRAHLFVALHCGAPLSAPSRHQLDEVDAVVIGRGSARATRRAREAGKALLHLTLADPHVSTAHARLTRQGGAWTFEDLGSKNGSFVNGTSLRRAPLADGDTLRIGQTLLVFRGALPTPPGTAPDVEGTARAPGLATLLPSLAREFDALASVAATDIPILLLSETGTGKEVVARAVHALSRRPGAFVPINCGALPTTLAESVLFGHKRGAFSGATGDSAGLLRSGDDGTLLLDELGDMPAALQPTLLRALQEGEVLPVGATAPVTFSARFIGATHHDLEAQVAAGTFREDLLARLSGFVFRIPPLRERREDIGMLTAALLAQLAQAGTPIPAITAEAGTLLLQYAWPRNVRELQKALRRAVLFAAGGPLEAAHLPPELQDRGAASEREAPRAPPRADDAAMRERILALLGEHRGNVQAVADAMLTSRSQVHRWARKLGIDLADFRR